MIQVEKDWPLRILCIPIGYLRSGISRSRVKAAQVVLVGWGSYMLTRGLTKDVPPFLGPVLNAAGSREV